VLIPDHADSFPNAESDHVPRTGQRRTGHPDVANPTKITLGDNGSTVLQIRNAEARKPCLKGKQTREEIRKTVDTRADCAFNHAFSDLCGPSATRPHNNHPRKVPIHGLRDEPQVGRALSAFTFRAEPSAGQKVKVFRPNGSGEHMASHLQKVAHHAVPSHDISPTHGLVSITPESLSGNKPDVSRLRVLGCKAPVHPENMRGKLNVRSLACVSLGFAQNNSAYRPSTALSPFHRIVQRHTR